MVRFQAGARDFFFFGFLQCVADRLLGSHILLVQWLPVIEKTGREADHSAPSGAKVKNEWGHTSIPQCLHAIRRGRLRLMGVNPVLNDEKLEV
jgi:hypothetical protein